MYILKFVSNDCTNHNTNPTLNLILTDHHDA